MTCHVILPPTSHKKQIDTLNSTHNNLSKDTATFHVNRRCQQYFSVKFWKHTEKCADIFNGPIKILRTQVFFRDGRQPEASRFFRPRPNSKKNLTKIKLFRLKCHYHGYVTCLAAMYRVCVWCNVNFCDCCVTEVFLSNTFTFNQQRNNIYDQGRPFLLSARRQPFPNLDALPLPSLLLLNFLPFRFLFCHCFFFLFSVA